MSGPDYGMLQEMERERFAMEMDICKRIAKVSLDDALYVAGSFGLKDDFQKEITNEMAG